MARTLVAPESAATIDSTPVPHPTSSTEIDVVAAVGTDGGARDRSALALSCDVGWSPRPNAPPGSITTRVTRFPPRSRSTRARSRGRRPVVGSTCSRHVSANVVDTSTTRHVQPGSSRAAARAIASSSCPTDVHSSMPAPPSAGTRSSTARTPSCQSRSLARSTSSVVDRDDERCGSTRASRGRSIEPPQSRPVLRDPLDVRVGADADRLQVRPCRA